MNFRQVTFQVLAAVLFCLGSLFLQAQPQTPREGEPWTLLLAENVKLEMLYVEPGTFLMGSPAAEQGREESETLHEVTLSQGYFLSKYEVTQSQWQTVMGKNPSQWKGENLPVEKVSWHDAMEFCKKLTDLQRASGSLTSSWEYTLPTEAQWEYACRSGSTTALGSGKNLDCPDPSARQKSPNLDEIAWYDKNSNAQTHPVGSKSPNLWGFYDMHGNVWEWCLDWYGDYSSDSVKDPLGPADGSAHIRRGGSWGYSPKGCRSAYRASYSPNYRLGSLGLRLALVPVSSF